LVNVLLNEYGAAADKAELLGVSAVGAAAARGHEAVVRLLLDNGADTQSRATLIYGPLNGSS
jgi:ankyrin repeat protein